MQVKGTTRGLALVVATSRPSSAERTEITGVMSPSPYSKADPKSPARTSPRLKLASRFLWSRASIAKTPPSPSSSARMMNKAYLMLTTNMSDQKIRDTNPRTFWGVGATAKWPVKHTLTA